MTGSQTGKNGLTMVKNKRLCTWNKTGDEDYISLTAENRENRERRRK